MGCGSSVAANPASMKDEVVIEKTVETPNGDGETPKEEDPDAWLTEWQAPSEADKESAATKIQAIQRGRQARADAAQYAAR